MINIFRKIHFNLVEQNKTGKYLKYAIGEIVLIVIGILIAISINNWNEERKDRIKEQVILHQLKEEYESNLKQLESKIKMRNIVIKSSQKLLAYIDNPGFVEGEVNSCSSSIHAITALATKRGSGGRE